MMPMPSLIRRIQREIPLFLRSDLQEGQRRLYLLYLSAEFRARKQGAPQPKISLTTYLL
eukprot:IDg12221t1